MTRPARPSRPFRSVLCFLSLIFFHYLAGCSSHRPIITRQPPPSPPTPVSSERAEAAKRSTDVGPDSSAASSPASTASRPNATPPSADYIEEGNASWYGVPYHGRRASNGEIYDMYRLTAAHRTLPFDTVVRVTNLLNNRSTIVRITDRGPFIDNRIIDLSLAAAREIDMVAAGVAPVRVEILSSPADPTGGFFTVQVGAFLDRGNAERFRERLAASYSNAAIQQFDSPDGLFYRVRVGRISGEDAARQFADSLRQKEGFSTPFVVRLDE